MMQKKSPRLHVNFKRWFLIPDSPQTRIIIFAVAVLVSLRFRIFPAALLIWRCGWEIMPLGTAGSIGAPGTEKQFAHWRIGRLLYM